MHGSPVLRTLVALVALLAAAVPMWNMTMVKNASAAGTTAQPAATPGAQQVTLEVAFAAKPSKFEVKYLGNTLWQKDQVNGLTDEKIVSMTVPKEGADLEYHVLWPAGTPLTAARLSMAVGDGDAVEKTLWGTGEVDDVLTFP